MSGRGGSRAFKGKGRGQFYFAPAGERHLCRQGGHNLLGEALEFRKVASGKLGISQGPVDCNFKRRGPACPHLDVERGCEL